MTYLNYRYKPMGDSILVTNDSMRWIFLSHEQFALLQKKQVEKNTPLYSKLVDLMFIIDKEKTSIETIAKSRREYMSHVFLGPALHIVVMTKRCNQQCKYCHAATFPDADTSRFDMSIENAKKVVDIIMSSPNDCITIEFQGGEALLNFEGIKFIYEYSTKLNKEKKKDLQHTIVTNLEIMDDQKFEYLSKNRISICTSFDGPQFLHDKNRPSLRTKSSYERVVHWIKKAREKDLVIGTLLTVSRETLKYPREIIDEYLSFGYKDIHLRELNYLGRAIGSWNEIGYRSDDFIKFWKEAMDYIIELNKKGIPFAERICTVMLKKILQKKDPMYVDLMTPCGAIIGQIVYNYDGKIYTCDEARTIGDDTFQVGTSDDTSIRQIVTRDKSIQIISQTINDGYYCDYCTYKPYCGLCPVLNYKKTGHVVEDVLRTDRCKILMAMFDYIFEKLRDDEIKKIFERWTEEKFYKVSEICI